MAEGVTVLARYRAQTKVVQVQGSPAMAEMNDDELCALGVEVTLSKPLATPPREERIIAGEGRDTFEHLGQLRELPFAQLLPLQALPDSFPVQRLRKKWVHWTKMSCWPSRG